MSIKVATLLTVLAVGVSVSVWLAHTPKPKLVVVSVETIAGMRHNQKLA